MAGLSNIIEEFLKEMLEENNGRLEIGRNDLANQFDCAPSQINYVLTTRFTPYKGYYIESRRGGSGYIRIIKLSFEEEDVQLEEMIYNSIGTSITKDKAGSLMKALQEEDIITERENLMIRHALEDQSLQRVPVNIRNKVRADLLRGILLAFLR
ncbi:MAG: CtsR family transcriptional regulator [Tissierellia bacterium]|nr:CtsR family transcriptional regulator [Tissierellia bacterium]